MKALQLYLMQKDIIVTDSIYEPSQKLKKVKWAEDDVELWDNAPPVIEMQYDHFNEFLLSVSFQIDAKKTTMREKEVLKRFNEIMVDQRIYRAEEKE